ncbi:YGGT family [Pantoea agglomerans]|uniref:YGGT family n=1 Tax=Enterobacter agglomerans TaxID=549 RepID=A0A379AB64_ENTAG|nr:YGGT family [Pantoea agglomerans]
MLLLRIWMQWSRCDFYNPVAQFVVKVTQPIVKPLRRILPALGPIDTASLLAAFVLTTLKYPILLLIQVASSQSTQPICWSACCRWLNPPAIWSSG